MKCAAACMRIESVRIDVFAITASYQPGVFGSKNVTRYVVGVSLTMCAFRHVTQNVTGWWIGVCADLIHFSPGAALSQRVSPMITAAGPPFAIWYLSRFGAASVQCVWSVLPMPDESESSVVSVFSAENVRVARETTDVPFRGGQGFGKGTFHVTGDLPRMRTSTA